MKKIFHKDQSWTRKFWIDEEIEEEHETELCKELELSREIVEMEQEEESFIFDNSFDEVINTSVRVSPDGKKITCHRGVQVFIPQGVTPEIKKCRKTSEKVRNAIATVSYKSAISVPKARVALQAKFCMVINIYLTHPLSNNTSRVWNKRTIQQKAKNCWWLCQVQECSTRC